MADRIDIERALDDLISNEEGMRFQGLEAHNLTGSFATCVQFLTSIPQNHEADFWSRRDAHSVRIIGAIY